MIRTGPERLRIYKTIFERHFSSRPDSLPQGHLEDCPFCSLDATPMDEPGQIKPALEHFGKTLSRWRR
jgi:hypothetical protein